MPKINLLSQEIAELIAAGEVVERPASVVKELVENSIDAGASHITVEIQRGGILYIRVTDDGCGIAPEDVSVAFMRHATSKISRSIDLDSISTLGFRGEALAATAAVSRIEMMTKIVSNDFGVRYIIEGGKEVLSEECGCADGTTIIIRDIFYNTPARMKFLKKDVSEGNTVAAVVERAALSHPEISFKLIREGKTTITTPGDGKLSSAIYSVLGRDFSKSLLPVSDENSLIKVNGFTCKPISCRQSRAGQYVFLNGRLVRSATVTAAVEQAYKNSAMIGKFPGFVLNVSMPFDMVDVNVHPAKTEVRFADERSVFDAVHYAVKKAIIAGDSRPVIDITPAKKQAETFVRMSAQEFREQTNGTQRSLVETAYNVSSSSKRLREDNTPFFMRQDVKDYLSQKETTQIDAPETVFSNSKASKKNIDIVVDEPKIESCVPETKEENIVEKKSSDSFEDVLNAQGSEIEIKYIGEAFCTYIVVEKDQSIFLIDKHAAHERMIYNRMKNERSVETQMLLDPVAVRLGNEEYTAAIENISLLLEAGFEVEDFGNSSIIIRSVPSSLKSEDVTSVITEACGSLLKKGIVDIDKLDALYHSVACKAAIKAGNLTHPTELLELAKKVLSDRDVMYCPHGRPVAFEIKRRDLEKQFGRIQ